jgi:hypothetical protein
MALSGTMSASSSYRRDPPSGANDGNLRTKWSNEKSFSTNGWLQLDLGTPVKVSSVTIVNK